VFKKKVGYDMASPSGDLYATQAQIARLEEIVQQQQLTIQNLQNQKNLFQNDVKLFIQEQMDEAAKQKGSRFSDYNSITRFVTKQLASAISQLHDSNSKLLEETIPSKILKDLEKRLLSKPCASDDLLTLSARVSALEVEVKPTLPASPVPTSTTIPAATQEEINSLKDHLEHLETKLFKEIQNAYKKAYKPGDYAAPLAKLQNQIALLQQEVATIKQVDTKEWAESFLKTSSANLRKELQDYMITRASMEDLHKFRADIERIEQFSKDVQVNTHRLQGEHQRIIEGVESRFSESALETIKSNLSRTIEGSLDKYLRKAETQLRLTLHEMQESKKAAEEEYQSLTLQVRSQYGPEMLANHMKQLEDALRAESTLFENELKQSTYDRCLRMEKEIQSLKSQVLEFTSDVKTQLQASNLKERYAFFEDSLAEQESKFEAFTNYLKKYEKKHEDSKETLYRLQEEINQTNATLNSEIQSAKLKLQEWKTSIKSELDAWLRDRQGQIQIRFSEAALEVQQVRDSFLVLQQELQHEILEHKQKEKYKEFQKALETKLKQWTHTKDEYLIQSLTDFSLKVKNYLQKVDERNAKLEERFSEETLQSFVKEFEYRIKQTTDDWMRRRTEEFTLRYGEFEKEVQRLYKLAEESKERETTLFLTYNEENLQNHISNSEKRLKDALDLWKKGESLKLEALRKEIKSELDESKFLKEIGEMQELRQFIQNDADAFKELYGEKTMRRFLLDLEAKANEKQKEMKSQISSTLEALKTRVDADLLQLTSTADQIEEAANLLKVNFGEEKLRQFVQESEKRLVFYNTKWKETQETILQAAKEEIQSTKQDISKFVTYLKSHYTEERLSILMTSVNEKYKIMMASLETSYSQRLQQKNEELAKRLDEYYESSIQDFEITKDKIVSEFETRFERESEKSSQTIKSKFVELDMVNHTLKEEQKDAVQRMNQKLVTISETFEQMRFFKEELTDLFRNKLLDYLREERVNEIKTFLLNTLSREILHLLTTKTNQELSKIYDDLQTFKKQFKKVGTELARPPNPWTELLEKKKKMYNTLTKCFYTTLFVKDSEVQNQKTLPPIQKRLDGWDYICFTNANVINQEGWIVEKVALNATDALALEQETQKYKWSSHDLLADYDVVCWGKVPNGKYDSVWCDWINQMVETNTQMLLMPHKYTKCAYNYLNTLLNSGLADPDDLAKVKSLMKQIGMPYDWGFYDTGYVLKLNKAKEVKQISEAMLRLMKETIWDDKLILPIVYYRKEFKKFSAQNLLQMF
jgi:enoyl-[acyl-carrier-protein] reductase (NADH)